MIICRRSRAGYCTTIQLCMVPGGDTKAQSPVKSGGWIIESGITDVAQLESTAAPGVLWLQRRKVEGFQA
ncbi:hypothetical protein ABC733_18300 [Mangrovibacter sp. SLW1]